MKHHKKYSVLGVNISINDYNSLLHTITFHARQHKALSVAPIASHPLVLATQNKKLHNVLQQFDFVLPDSQYIRHALYFLYGVKLKTRLYGPELFLRLCKEAESAQTTLFLYGNSIELLKKNLLAPFPELRLEGIDLAGKKVNEKELSELKIRLKNKKNYVLCIGIGSPKQHYIMHNLSRLPAPIIAVGAAFDFYTGIQPHAPIWIQNAGLEWLFRLLHEPKRLWKRYIIYGALFVLLIVWQKFKQMRDTIQSQ